MSEKKYKCLSVKSSVRFSVFFSATVLLVSAFFYQFMPQATNISLPAGSSPSNVPTVILDPGHGGVDSGAVSVTGAEEKNLNLALAKKVGSFLEAGGIRVIYTRTEDTLLSSERGNSRKTKDLLGRVEIAGSHPNALFVSLHMNTLPIEKYRGLQSFYSDRNGKSEELAKSIQSTVSSLLQPENNRKAKMTNGNVYILDRIDQPSVLIECGFLTNNEEARLLEDPLYQNKLAFTISRPILWYMQKSEEN